MRNKELGMAQVRTPMQTLADAPSESPHPATVPPLLPRAPFLTSLVNSTLTQSAGASTIMVAVDLYGTLQFLAISIRYCSTRTWGRVFTFNLHIQSKEFNRNPGKEKRWTKQIEV